MVLIGDNLAISRGLNSRAILKFVSRRPAITTLTLQILGLCLWLGWASAVGAQENPNPTRLAIGDRIQVITIGHEQYSGEFLVLDDGTVTGPGFNNVPAAGRSLDQVRVSIRDALRRFLRDPEVSVSLAVPAPRFVFVIGTLGTRERIVHLPQMTLGAALGDLVLPSPSADFEVQLRRDGTELLRVPLSRFLSAGMFANEPVFPDDLIVISAFPKVRVWVTGFVFDSGQFFVLEGATLNQVLAEAGGLRNPEVLPNASTVSERAQRMIVEVRRGPETFTFQSGDLAALNGFVMEAGDTVTVNPAPQVTVTVTGNVANPGNYQLDQGATLRQAVSSANGPSATGTLSRVNVLRDGNVFRYDLVNPEALNPELLAGDIVIVQETQNYAYVLGEANQPGRFLISETEETRASDLLSLARGVNPRGSLLRMTLVRPTDTGEMEMIEFNLDRFLKDGDLASNPVVEPGDVLFVQTPRGVSINQITQAITTFLLLERLF